jgi:hypothetical protein|tara:strand:+ start:422 stop:805 length:384 start_codon:yes stop_codon:yes gene_type:complete
MSDIPDYMRGFDLDQDFGFTPVNQKPVEEKVVVGENKETNIEISKVKSDVQTIKSMMNEIMQIVAEKDTITTEISNEETVKRFKEVEKVILPFLYNLAKSEEDYIYWPNRGPIIKAQIEKILKLTRG